MELGARIQKGKTVSDMMSHRTVLGAGMVLAVGAVGLIGVDESTAASSSSFAVWHSDQTGTSQVEYGGDLSVESGTLHADATVWVDDSVTGQSYMGVGASFTDSSAQLMMQLKNDDKAAYDELLNRVFSPSEYNMTVWRVPMGSSDFTGAAAHWTNADVKGPDDDVLANFALTPRDTQYIIPLIKDALAVNPDLKLIASPWGAPAWMKTNDSIVCHSNGVDGELRYEYRQAWAEYFVKWLDAYRAQGIEMWAVTPQNEPRYCPDTYPGISWTAESQVQWITTNLVPTLRMNGYQQQIFGWDHNFTSAEFAATLLHQTTNNELSGFAWHCYDNDADPAYMEKVYNIDPSRRVIESECSSTSAPTDIIRFSSAEMALRSFQNRAEAVILWNFALDKFGGPHLGGCVGCHPLVTVDAPASSSAHWTVHPNLSHMAQISRFVAQGATQVASTEDAHGVVTAAFKNPNGELVIIANNSRDTNASIAINVNRHSHVLYTFGPRETVTFVGAVPAASPLPTTPTAERSYRIVSRASGKTIGTCAGSTDNGACIVQWVDDGDLDQRWIVRDAGDGYVNLVNAKSGKALDVPNGQSANGTQLQQWEITGNGNVNQQWRVVARAGGWLSIVNRGNGRAVDLPSGSVMNGEVYQQWAADPLNTNQQFMFVPVD
ncbi:RICIN domain-containing protein [Actinomyces mediterranea]|uniref:RICIN domain-containing protein n=1 Tax=Actinomyces mediterranea TaxID=1871028 RepID=UPI00097104BD|nr:RICIN domain-containing protein [Actinomyces mediterranea]